MTTEMRGNTAPTAHVPITMALIPTTPIATAETHTLRGRLTRSTVAITLFGVLALILSACGATYDYGELRKMKAPGGNFNSALAREYQSFALFEADAMYDWPDAAHFGTKAMQSADGNPPAPERPENWDLPPAKAPEFSAAHDRLTRAFATGARSNMPTIAARAQALFDCWIEQQEENWQATHIAGCRKGFYASLNTLEAVAGLPPGVSGDAGFIPAALRSMEQVRKFDPVLRDTTQSAKLAAPQSQTPSQTKGYRIHFAFNQATLDATARATLRALVEGANQGSDVSIVIGGHADRSGSRSYNHTLSRKRAESVRHALMAMGIEKSRMSLNAFGETRNRITTPDGQREPRNRRAEIVIGPASRL